MFRLIIIFSLFYGCASTSSKMGPKKLEDISDKDFKKVRQIKFRRSDDILNNIKSEYTSATNTESLQRVILLDGDIDKSDDFSKITKACLEKKYDEAYTLIRQNNRKYINNPIFWNQVGICYQLQRKRRKALLFFNKSLALKGDYAPAVNNLGVLYTQEGDYDKAMVAFERAKKFQNYSRTPRLNLAILYLKFGLYQYANDELAVLRRVSSKDLDVLSLSATSLLMEGKYKNAVDLFQQIPKKFYEQESVGINYAIALFLSGEKREAVDILEDVELSSDSNWKSYYVYAAREIGVN